MCWTTGGSCKSLSSRTTMMLKCRISGNAVLTQRNKGVIPELRASAHVPYLRPRARNFRRPGIVSHEILSDGEAFCLKIIISIFLPQSLYMGARRPCTFPGIPTAKQGQDFGISHLQYQDNLTSWRDFARSLPRHINPKKKTPRADLCNYPDLTRSI